MNIETQSAPVAPSTPIALTPRQRDVLVEIAEGYSNFRIGRRLGIAQHTVKFHVSALMDKFSARTRTHMVAIALRRGIIQ